MSTTLILLIGFIASVSFFGGLYVFLLRKKVKKQGNETYPLW